jgi:glucose-6-phosphate isomerase
MRLKLHNLDLGDAALRPVLLSLEKGGVVGRIGRKDPSVWKGRSEEVRNRLGWVDAPGRMEGARGEAEAFAREAVSAGFKRVLLLGMGGSSLAPEVLAKLAGPRADGLPLEVLDSTDPAAVLRATRRFGVDDTLYLVSSKSGTTLETAALMDYFFARAAAVLGPRKAGERFAAITDPGSELEGEARRRGFRAVVPGDPEIGGRFSALSPFGLLPAALLGLDTSRLLDRAREEMLASRHERLEDNPAALLGALLGASASAGRDKAVFLLSPALSSFGAWVEQLLAESTGKDGRGILPLVRFAEGFPDHPSADMVFVSLALGEDEDLARREAALASQGAPLLSLALSSTDEIGGQFYAWEFATAVAGAVLGINPFDQPQVALSKDKTAAALGRLRRGERTAGPRPAAREGGLLLFLDGQASSVGRGLGEFFAGLKAGDYAVLQAFLPPFPEVEASLRSLAGKVGKRTGRPVAYDFGPRFLHSTGQLHKGDRGNGRFLQLTAGHPEDAALPSSADEPESRITFGQLLDAQARGDREALAEKGRLLARVHLEGEIVEGLGRLAALL